MVAVKLDLIGDNSVEVGADYSRQITVCNQPDLTLYVGTSQIRNSKDEVILSPIIVVQSPTIFAINLTSINTALLRLVVGDLVYDVMFSKTNHKFYSVRGKLTFINGITRIVV